MHLGKTTNLKTEGLVAHILLDEMAADATKLEGARFCEYMNKVTWCAIIQRRHSPEPRMEGRKKLVGLHQNPLMNKPFLSAWPPPPASGVLGQAAARLLD